MLMILIRTVGVVIRAHQVGAKIDFSELRQRHQRPLLGRARLMHSASAEPTEPVAD
jgi:hypothetical protein